MFFGAILLLPHAKLLKLGRAGKSSFISIKSENTVGEAWINVTLFFNTHSNTSLALNVFFKNKRPPAYINNPNKATIPDRSCYY